MRKVILNPVTAFAVETALFFLVKSWIGDPSDALVGIGFLLLFGYACNLTYLLWFLASPVLRKMWKIKRMEEDPLSFYIMAVPNTIMHLVILASMALVFGADPGVVTRIAATVIAVFGAMATAPLYFPEAEAWARERFRNFTFPA